MGFQDFSKYQWIKTIDTGESIYCGKFTFDEDLALYNARITIFMQGAATSEQVKIELHAEETGNSKIYESSYSDLIDMNYTSSAIIGYLRLDFDGENIKKDIAYYPFVNTNNYTRNGDSLYIGIAYDYPVSFYDTGITPDNYYNHPLAVQFYGKINGK